MFYVNTRWKVLQVELAVANHMAVIWESIPCTPEFDSCFPVHIAHRRRYLTRYVDARDKGNEESIL